MRYKGAIILVVLGSFLIPKQAMYGQALVNDVLLTAALIQLSQGMWQISADLNVIDTVSLPSVMNSFSLMEASFSKILINAIAESELLQKLVFGTLVNIYEFSNEDWGPVLDLFKPQVVRKYDSKNYQEYLLAVDGLDNLMGSGLHDLYQAPPMTLPDGTAINYDLDYFKRFNLEDLLFTSAHSVYDQTKDLLQELQKLAYTHLSIAGEGMAPVTSDVLASKILAAEGVLDFVKRKRANSVHLFELVSCINTSQEMKEGFARKELMRSRNQQALNNISIYLNKLKYRN